MPYTWTQQDANRARADDTRHNREHPAVNRKGSPIQWRRSVNQRAVMEGLKSEGIAGDTVASEAYMMEMEKRYPEILADDRYRHRYAARAGRFGMPSWTFRAGRWFRVKSNGILEGVANCPRIRTVAPGYVLPSRVQE